MHLLRQIVSRCVGVAEGLDLSAHSGFVCFPELLVLADFSDFPKKVVRNKFCVNKASVKWLFFIFSQTSVYYLCIDIKPVIRILLVGNFFWVAASGERGGLFFTNLFMLSIIKRFYPTFLLLALIFYLSLSDAHTFDALPTFHYADKVVHFLMYSALSFVFLFDLYRTTPVLLMSWQHIVAVLAICTLVGGSLELLQELLTTTRFASWGDFLANTLGTLWGVSLGRALFPGLKEWYWVRKGLL